MTRALLAALLLSAAVPAAAQVPFDRNRDQAFGVVAGLASGGGVMYKEVLPNAFGYRVAAALWKLGDFSVVDVGVYGMRILSDDGRRRVYLVGGGAYWRRSDEEERTTFDDQGNVVETRIVDDVDDSFGLGLGLGVELPLGARTSASLEGVFSYWTDTGDVLPLPQVGIHYDF